MSEYEQQAEDDGDPGFVGGGGIAETIDGGDDAEADLHGDALDKPEGDDD